MENTILESLTDLDLSKVTDVILPDQNITCLLPCCVYNLSSIKPAAHIYCKIKLLSVLQVMQGTYTSQKHR